MEAQTQSRSLLLCRILLLTSVMSMVHAACPPGYSGATCKTENVCFCKDGVRAKVADGKCRENATSARVEGAPDECCEADGTADCSICNPHFRMEYDNTTETGSCVSCPLGSYNLATQFHPLHQKGVYKEAARHYYTVKDVFYSDREINDAFTCQLDKDDTCMQIKPEIKADCEGQGCDEESSLRSQCWSSVRCQWFAAEKTCFLRDPCVRKAKTQCRSASHCSWGMNTGRCTEAKEISDQTCMLKSMNGCINDFFCKWSEASGALGECKRHPCRDAEKDVCIHDRTECRWNTQRTRCDTTGNSWSTEKRSQKNWVWDSGEFVRNVNNDDVVDDDEQ